MRGTFERLILLAVIAPAATLVFAQRSSCRVEPFQGATLPDGATTRMTVTNTGSACSITNYGVPVDRKNPADSGSITVKPMHGVAEFVAAQARYTPEPGFVGEDAFTFEAFAKGSINQQLRLKVQVKVKVTAP